MKIQTKLTLAIIFCLLFSLSISAQKKASAKSKATNQPKSLSVLPPLKLEQYTLKNGLRVVLHQDNSIPIIGVSVYYDVGSRNEKQGRTGFAHLFEHMMFQGSENVKKAEHFQYISRVGGQMNGSTNSEYTNYYQAVPANQLPTVLWLESDRMRSLKITKENLDNQKEAVKEEKRMRRDNQPYGQVFDIITEMTYKNFANSHSTIGSMDDLNAASVEDVAEFFRIYYAPNNAILSISGSFDSVQAKALIAKYFETIPAQPKPAAMDFSEPTELAEKSKTYTDKLAPFPAFLFSWKVPAQTSDEYKALSLAGKLLYEGESSRLYQKLVKGDESVLQLFGFNQTRRSSSMAIIGAIPKPGKDLAQIKKVILDEIKTMATNGPTADEMSKLRNQIVNEQIRSRQNSMNRSMLLAEFALVYGDAEYFNKELDSMLKITPEQIKNVVNKYLNTENRAVLDIVTGK